MADSGALRARRARAHRRGDHGLCRADGCVAAARAAVAAGRLDDLDPLARALLADVDDGLAMVLSRAVDDGAPALGRGEPGSRW